MSIDPYPPTVFVLTAMLCALLVGLLWGDVASTDETVIATALILGCSTLAAGATKLARS